MLQVVPRFTYEDYCLLPEERRCELIEGDFLMTPAPARRHQQIVRKLVVQLDLYAQCSGSGEVYVAPLDVILDDFNVVQPDVVWVSPARKAIEVEEGLRGAPDLVVEVLSPSTSRRDRELKRKLYFRYGVEEFWLVDPQGSVEVLRRGARGFRLAARLAGGQVLTSRLLPGFEVPVEGLFPRE